MNSNYPPGVTTADIDEAAGAYPSNEGRADIEAERGDMARDREIDNE